MRRFCILLLSLQVSSMIAGSLGPLQITNVNVNLQMVGDSYYYDDQHGVGFMDPDAAFATLARYYPTNNWRFNNASRSGGTPINTLTNLIYPSIFPFAGWRSNDYQNIVIYKSTENGSPGGAGDFLNTWQYFSNFVKAPGTMYLGDGTPTTIIGWAAVHNYQSIGLSDYPASANDGNINTRGQESLAITNAGVLLGFGAFDIYWHTYDAWTNDNQTGANNVQYTPAALDHPGAGGHGYGNLELFPQMLPDTNVADAVVDWVSLSVTTNHCVISSVTKNGNTLQFNRLDNRLYPIYGDIPGNDGYGNIITNDWRSGIKMKPSAANNMWFGMSVSSLPVGNYTVYIDGTNCGIFDSTTLSHWNMTTNYVGPYALQATKTLTDVRIMDGVDPVSRIPRSAGDGVGLSWWGSNVASQYQAGNRGDAFLAATATFGDRLSTNYTQIHLDAQPTSHQFTIIQSLGTISANTINVGTMTIYK